LLSVAEDHSECPLLSVTEDHSECLLLSVTEDQGHPTYSGKAQQLLLWTGQQATHKKTHKW
jgi:hypothetical protein